MRFLVPTVLALPVLVLVPAPCLRADVIPAGGFPAITFELREGSMLVDDCFCDRVPIEVPIRGTIVLRRLPVRIIGELYDIESVDIQSVAPGALDEGYTVTGKGSFYRRASEPDPQSMSLTAAVNGATPIELKAENVDASSPWPRIDIRIDESRDPARDPFHIYSLRIVAEPTAATWRYQLIEGSRENFEGSFFYDDCDICGRPTIPIPVAGSFLLTEPLDNSANPVTTYSVHDLVLRAADGNATYDVAGGGTYQHGGEVELHQRLDLLVSVNKETDIHLDSGEVSLPEGAHFPEIRIRVEQVNAPSPTHVYRLDLWAQRASAPPPPVEFRRGDANGDGTGDISDAVFVLLWRFSGGGAPACLAAADINGDSQHDLSDAVYLLLHLFQGGESPPAPGLSACGPPGPADFGCETPACP